MQEQEKIYKKTLLPHVSFFFSAGGVGHKRGNQPHHLDDEAGAEEPAEAEAAAAAWAVAMAAACAWACAVEPRGAELGDTAPATRREAMKMRCNERNTRHD